MSTETSKCVAIAISTLVFVILVSLAGWAACRSRMSVIVLATEPSAPPAASGATSALPDARILLPHGSSGADMIPDDRTKLRLGRSGAAVVPDDRTRVRMSRSGAAGLIPDDRTKFRTERSGAQHVVQ